jgi:hypothetical protein
MIKKYSHLSAAYKDAVSKLDEVDATEEKNQSGDAHFSETEIHELFPCEEEPPEGRVDLTEVEDLIEASQRDAYVAVND